MPAPSVAERLLSSLIDRIGQERWLSFSEADRALISACCADAAALQLALLAAGDDASAGERVEREKSHVTAQLASVSAAAGVALEDALWRAASNLLLRAGRLLLGP